MFGFNSTLLKVFSQFFIFKPYTVSQRIWLDLPYGTSARARTAKWKSLF